MGLISNFHPSLLFRTQIYIFFFFFLRRESRKEKNWKVHFQSEKKNTTPVWICCKTCTYVTFWKLQFLVDKVRHIFFWQFLSFCMVSYFMIVLIFMKTYSFHLQGSWMHFFRFQKQLNAYTVISKVQFFGFWISILNSKSKGLKSLPLLEEKGWMQRIVLELHSQVSFHKLSFNPL